MKEIKKLINTLTVKELKNYLNNVDENTIIDVWTDTDFIGKVEIEIINWGYNIADTVCINLIK